MLHTIGLFLASFIRLFRSHRSLWLENVALRQQLVILKRKHPRPRLTGLDKLFWVLTRKYWPRWKQALILVSSETIPRWLSLPKSPFSKKTLNLRDRKSTRLNSRHLGIS